MTTAASRPRTPRRAPTPAMLAVCVFICLAMLRLLMFRPEDGSNPEFLESVQVRHVLDGDTIILSDDRRVRLLGIDAPELAHEDKPAERLAEASRDWLKARVEGRSVRLRCGERTHDRYGRLLAWVFLESRLVNQDILADGMAKLLPDYGLPLDLEPGLREAESIARVKKSGIWARTQSGKR